MDTEYSRKHRIAVTELLKTNSFSVSAVNLFVSELRMRRKTQAESFGNRGLVDTSSDTFQVIQTPEEKKDVCLGVHLYDFYS
jgi:hypothetical protein